MTAWTAVRRFTQEARAVWWVFGIAFGVRVVLLVLLHDSYYTSGMAQGELARNLAEGRGFVVNVPFSASVGEAQWNENRLIDISEALSRWTPEDTPENLRPFVAYMMPGQSMLLALTYLVTGSYSYLPLQILLVVLDSCSVFLLVSIGTILFTREAGILAAALFAIYIPEARLAVTATRDAWMPLMYILMAYCAVRSWKSGKARDHLLFGLSVAVAAYFRSEVLLITLWAGIFFLLAGSGVSRSIRQIALTLVPIVVLIAPWTIRNYIVFDRLIPTNTGLWLSVWQSFGEYPNDFGAVNNDVVTLRQMQAAGHTETYDSPEYDALFRPMVLRVLSERPGWVAWTIARRAARVPFQMHSWGLPATDDIHGPNSSYPTGRVDLGSYVDLVSHDPGRLVVHIIARSVNLLLYLAVAVWFWRNRQGPWQAGLVLLSIPLYNISVHAVLGVMARYILPTNSLHLLFAASLILAFAERKHQAETA